MTMRHLRQRQWVKDAIDSIGDNKPFIAMDVFDKINEKYEHPPQPSRIGHFLRNPELRLEKVGKKNIYKGGNATNAMVWIRRK